MRRWEDFGIVVPYGKFGDEDIKLPCPQCQNTRQTNKGDKPLSVNPEKKIWKCHHCGWSGSLYEKSDGLFIPKVSKIYRRPVYKVESPNEKILGWFASRKISKDVIERNKIIYTKHFFPQTEKEETCIAFPYFRNGETVNIKYRDGNKNFVQEKDAEPIVFKFDDVAGQEEIGICEGEVDSLSFEAIGLLNFCSVPNGAINENDKKVEGKLEFLESLQPHLENAKRVILAVDNDGPGRRLQEELAWRIGKERCWWIEYPEGCKDANDVLVKFGQEKLFECYQKANQYPVQGIIRAGDVVEGIGNIYLHGFKRGNSTGWESLDELYTVRKGEFTVISGIPGHGKSSWVDALMVNLSRKYDWKFAVFTPENMPVERYYAGLAEKVLMKPITMGPRERMTPGELEGVIKWLHERFFVIAPDENVCTLSDVLRLAKAAILQHGVDGVAIDPWNELEHNRPTGITETEYVSASLSKTRRFAKSRDVHVWIVAHPTKLSRDKHGKYPRPSLYDITGSANWRNKPDNGIIVWRDPAFGENITQVSVQKIRFKEIGKLGDVELKYDRATGCYSEIKKVLESQSGWWNDEQEKMPF